jgi:hypothetical protein
MTSISSSLLIVPHTRPEILKKAFAWLNLQSKAHAGKHVTGRVKTNLKEKLYLAQAQEILRK